MIIKGLFTKIRLVRGLINKSVLSVSLILLLAACSSMPYDPATRTSSFHKGFDNSSHLAEYFTQYQPDNASLSGFSPLGGGQSSFSTRLELIKLANSTIDLQYYIFKDDKASRAILLRLQDAANRGVRIRILVDGMQQVTDSRIVKLALHENVEIRMFNPLKYNGLRFLSYLSEFERVNRRMHNKSITVDGVTSVIGGRNIGNEYYAVASHVVFNDFDVLLFGAIVENIAQQFDDYWNSHYAVPTYMLYPDVGTTKNGLFNEAETNALTRVIDKAEQLEGAILFPSLQAQGSPWFYGNAILGYDDPNKVHSDSRQLVELLTDVLNKTSKTLTIVSPYFVPTEDGVNALIRASQRGIDITIVTNSLASTDVFAVHGWYAKYRKSLVNAGIQLWEVKATGDKASFGITTGSSKASLHAKLLVIDDDIFATGSMNMDPRSGNLNTELMVFLTSPEFVSFIKPVMRERLTESAYKVEVNNDKLIWRDLQSNTITEHEPDASVFRRFGAWIAGLLPIEQLL
ncbi:phospholipase D family protein [Alteromonas gracilis]|uniref:phospholipase D family protein n=1 Tax=Alteromonas gracilis TaxID=1479524 RepID=UPI0030D13BE5